MISKRGRLAHSIACAIGDAPRPAPKPPLFDSRNHVQPAVFHVIYKDASGLTQTGRVSVTDDRFISAGMLRERAIKAAAWKFQCRPNSVRAVRVWPPSSTFRMNT